MFLSIMLNYKIELFGNQNAAVPPPVAGVYMGAHARSIATLVAMECVIHLD